MKTASIFALLALLGLVARPARAQTVISAPISEQISRKQILHQGVSTTLGRNGSDFSGSIFGALLEAVEIVISRRVGETEQLYGSVTSADIADFLKGKGFDIDRRNNSTASALANHSAASTATQNAGSVSVIAGALGERRSRVAAVVPVGTHVLGDRIAQAIKHGGTVAFGNGHIICHVLGHRLEGQRRRAPGDAGAIESVGAPCRTFGGGCAACPSLRNCLPEKTQRRGGRSRRGRWRRRRERPAAGGA